MTHSPRLRRMDMGYFPPGNRRYTALPPKTICRFLPFTQAGGIWGPGLPAGQAIFWEDGIFSLFPIDFAGKIWYKKSNLQLNYCGSIEARFASVPGFIQDGIPAGERENRRSVRRFPGRRTLGRWRISCGLSHFVERYHSRSCSLFTCCRECWMFPRFAVFSCGI